MSKVTKLRSLRTRQAFTLVELLTVIAITGILATLVFTVLGSVRESAKRAGGVNALRQVGTAIKLYHQEHGGAMPGPLWPGQVPYYERDEQGRLAFHLAPYLDVPVGTSERFLTQALVPPAYPLEELNVNEPRTFVINTKVRNPGSDVEFNVWGVRPEIADDPANTIPQNHASILSPSTTWAVMDADQQHPRVSGKPWSGSTPSEPIHGSVRHALFFDGHVEAVALDFGE